MVTLTYIDAYQVKRTTTYTDLAACILAFSGCVTKDAVKCNEAGIDAFFPVLRSVVTPEEAMNTQNAYNNMADTAEQVFRVINTFNTIKL